ncbi:hypothetical protein [Alicyclobacillus vulcanalis]|nr:hypothetical protein [Alicyclobacillus vulcanalis]
MVDFALQMGDLATARDVLRMNPVADGEIDRRLAETAIREGHGKSQRRP